MKNTNIQVLATGLRFPEGPAFDATGALWAVELKGESLVRYANGKLESFFVGGAPNGIAIDAYEAIWFCDSAYNAIRKFDPLTHITETMATAVNGEELHKPNDLVFDGAGNVLFTCPGESRTAPTGYVCVLMKNGKVKKIMEDKYFPNGLAFTNNYTELVLAETYRHRLWKARWDADNCTLYNASVWCEIGGPNGPGGPDGMAFHANGNLHVAVYGTGQVRLVNEQGDHYDAISLPGNNPTNCAFDPSGELGLVVTEAELGQLLSIKNYQ